MTTQSNNDVTAARELLNNFVEADWTKSYLTTDGEVHSSCCVCFGYVLKWILPTTTLKEMFYSDAEKGLEKIREAFNAVSEKLSIDEHLTLSQKITAKAQELDMKIYKAPRERFFGGTTPPPAAPNSNSEIPPAQQVEEAFPLVSASSQSQLSSSTAEVEEEKSSSSSEGEQEVEKVLQGLIQDDSIPANIVENAQGPSSENNNSAISSDVQQKEKSSPEQVSEKPRKKRKKKREKGPNLLDSKTREKPIKNLFDKAEKK